MTAETKRFHDDLADSYHLIFKDWEHARTRQTTPSNWIFFEANSLNIIDVNEEATGV